MLSLVVHISYEGSEIFEKKIYIHIFFLSAMLAYYLHNSMNHQRKHFIILKKSKNKQKIIYCVIFHTVCIHFVIHVSVQKHIINFINLEPVQCTYTLFYIHLQAHLIEVHYVLRTCQTYVQSNFACFYA